MAPAGPKLGAGAVIKNAEDAKPVADGGKGTKVVLMDFCTFHGIVPAKGSGAGGAVLVKDLSKVAVKFMKEMKKVQDGGKPNPKDDNKNKDTKPRCKITTPPKYEESFERFRLWKLELADWEEKSLADGHNASDMYTEVKANLPEDVRAKFLTSHMKPGERTYATIIEFLTREHKAESEAVAEADRTRFYGYVRGNVSLQKGHEEWSDLYAIALSSGGIEESDRDWKDLLQAMNFDTKEEAKLLKDLADEERRQLALYNQNNAMGALGGANFKFDKLKELKTLFGYIEQAEAESKARSKARKAVGLDKKKESNHFTEVKKEIKKEKKEKNKKKKKKHKKNKKKKDSEDTEDEEEATGFWGKKGGKAKGGKKGKSSWKGSDGAKGSWSSGKGPWNGGQGQHKGSWSQKGSSFGSWSGSWKGAGKDGKGGKKGSSDGGKGQKGKTDSDGKGGQGKRGGFGQWLPGDWACPSCGDHQFAKNEYCRGCGTRKPAGSPTPY